EHLISTVIELSRLADSQEIRDRVRELRTDCGNACRVENLHASRVGGDNPEDRFAMMAGVDQLLTAPDCDRPGIGRDITRKGEVTSANGGGSVENLSEAIQIMLHCISKHLAAAQQFEQVFVRTGHTSAVQHLLSGEVTRSYGRIHFASNDHRNGRKGGRKHPAQNLFGP
ncbi:MAG TPA: hypothetical protein VL282_06645, partial [Tepidisphaeraceae bacterium]|nr:hypothetical protein [Tepidisphaeraceae bacterium]